MTWSRSLALGAGLVAVSGLGLVGYGIAVVIQNFTGFIELGLSTELAGATPDQIAEFSPRLYGYIGHLQVSLGEEAAACMMDPRRIAFLMTSR